MSSDKLAAALAQINKTYGKETIMRASEAKALQLQRVPFSIPSLDLGSGGGVPRGRIIMLKGEESTGKSLVAMKALVQFQRRCRFCGMEREVFNMFTGEVEDGPCTCDNTAPMQCIWLDVEGAWDNAWGLKQGVDLSNLHVIRPSYTEQGVDVTDLVIRSRECDLVVVDSVAAMAPSIETTESAENQQIGVQARLVNKAMRKWTSGMNSCGMMVHAGNPAVIMINQVRVKIGVTFGSNETTPGGKGQNFHSSIIFRMASRGLLKVETGRDLKKGDKTEKEVLVVGKSMAFDTSKNKTAAPHRSGVFDFYFSDVPELGFRAGDIDMGEQWFALGMKYGLITQKGAWYSVGEERIGQGKDKVKSVMTDHPDLCEKIWETAALEELGFVP